MHDLHSDSLLESLTVTEPVGEGASHTLLVNLANCMPQTIHALINAQLSLLPNSDGTLLSKLTVAHEDSPDAISSSCLQLDLIMLSLKVLTPGIEGLSLQPVAFAHQSNVLVLANLSERLQAGIVPAVEGDTKSVQTEAMSDLRESLQLIVTVTVEFGVFTQLLVGYIDATV